MNKKILVQSIICLAEENGIEDALRFALIEKAAKRQKFPFELHYTDGYRSWFFEKNKVVDAFYYGGYLVNIYDTKAVGVYAEAKQRAETMLIGGMKSQMVSPDLCTKMHEEIATINSMINKLGGDALRGEVWVKTEGKNYCFNFNTGKLVPRRGDVSELMTRAVVCL